jgi:threonine dehydratase
MTNAIDTQLFEEISDKRLSAAREVLTGRLRRTPIVAWPDDELGSSNGGELLLKLEVLQHAGCFKTRGALLHLLSLDSSERARGVVTASAGNHAACVSFAAHVAGASAKVVVPRTASPSRLEICRRYGAEVIVTDNIHAAFDEMSRVCTAEGRTVIHPFDSSFMVLGAAVLAAELVEQLGQLDAVVVAVGGGALCGGIAAAMRLLAPSCDVYGVEPRNADKMCRSLETGTPQRLEGVTVADSLAAPGATARTLALCRMARAVVRVEETQIIEALRALFTTMKLAVEPAAAAALAGVRGPLQTQLAGKRVAVVLCGTNISPSAYAELLAPTERAAAHD